LTSLFIVGFIADHFGAKRTYILAGIASCASPWAFVLFADGFWSAFWLHALTGLCQGGNYTPALARINDHVGRERRGRAMGYLIAGSSAGYALCLAVAGAALTFTDWRGALTAVALPAGHVVVAGDFCLETDPQSVHPRPAGESLLAAVPAVWRKPARHAFDLGLHLPQLGVARPVGMVAAFLTAALAAAGTFSGERALMFAGLTYLANIAGTSWPHSATRRCGGHPDHPHLVVRQSRAVVLDREADRCAARAAGRTGRLQLREHRRSSSIRRCSPRACILTPRRCWRGR